MRHRKSFNHLGRKTAHRSAMLANMAASLILHKRIETTTAKAKALRMYVEPLITKSKDDTTHSRRVVFSYLQNKDAVTELFRDVAVKVADRPGGYLRLFKIGSRLGDNADMCIVELVDYNENLISEKDDSSKAKPGRKRRGAKKKTAEEKQLTPAAAVVPGKVKADTEESVVADSDTENENNPPVGTDDAEIIDVEAKVDEPAVSEEEENKKIAEAQEDTTTDKEAEDVKGVDENNAGEEIEKG